MSHTEPPLRDDERPLNARSVILSVILGTDPPALPVSWIVRAGELFEIGEGTVRTALTRMTQNGELARTGEGWYTLVGEQSLRQIRQRESESAVTVPWNGRWTMAVVTAEERTARERLALRRDMDRLRLVEQREGVWLRPDNLDPARLAEVRERVLRQTYWYFAQPWRDESELAAACWPLEQWSTRAVELQRQVVSTGSALDGGDPAILREGFRLSARVLRHFQKDPLLPPELLPPSWPGPALRTAFRRFDRSYRDALAVWVRPAIR